MITLSFNPFHLGVITSIQGRGFFHKRMKGVDDIFSRNGMTVGKASLFAKPNVKVGSIGRQLKSFG